MYSRNIYKSMYISGFLVSLFLVVGVMFSPSVSADKATEHAKCLDGAGELNAVLFVRFRDATTGAVFGYSNDFAFGVTAVKEGSYSKANNDDQVATYDNEYKQNTIVRFEDKKFSAFGPSQTFTAKRAANGSIAKNQGQLCDPDNTAGGKVLAYAFRSGDGSTYFPGMGTPSVAYNDNNGSMSLSCLHKSNIGFKFNFGGVADKPAGRTLSHTKVETSLSSGIRRANSKNATPDTSLVYIFGMNGGTVNGDQTRIYYDMYFNAPPPPVISPVTDITGGLPTEIEAGETATPTAGIAGTGGSATWTWSFWYDNGGVVDAYDNAADKPVLATGLDKVGTATAPTSNLSGGHTSTTVNVQHARICSRLTLSGAVGATISPTTRVKCKNIVRKPYLSAQNGDVNTTCAPAGTGTIRAQWNTTASNGSSTNLAIYAGAAVNGFASAFGRTSPGPLKGLTFADDGTSFGGKVTGQVGDCANLGEIPAALSIPSGDTTISSWNGIKADTDRYKNGVFYVDGNLVIADAIQYSGSTTNLKLDTLPYLKVVVKGDIYIQPNVSRIEGVYQASGTIYTCAPSGTKPTSLTPTSCNSTLTVYGALEANNIRFLRLNGATVTPNTPAEHIIFSPFSWLNAIKPDTNPDQPDAKFDSYTVMPPVL